MKIYVDTEEQKQELLRQSEYIHDFVEVIKFKTKDGKIKEKWIGLDSDKAGTLKMTIEAENTNEPQKPQLNIPAVIRSYSDKEIFIEVLAGIN